MKHPISMWRAACVAVLCWSAAVHAADPAIRLGPGVVLDRQRQQAYLADPGGRVQAIGLAQGTRVWQGSERGLPLAVLADHVLVLGSVEQWGLGMLQQLHPDTGVTLDRIEFDLPERVSADVAPAPGRHFEAQLDQQAAGLRLHWRFQAQPLRGMAPENEAEALGAGTNGAVALVGALDLLNEAQGLRTQTLRDALPWPDGPSPLLAGSEAIPGQDGRQFRSADATHVLLSTWNEATGMNRWTVLERTSGRVLGRLESPYALAPFVVLDEGVLLYRARPYGALDAQGRWFEHGEQLVAWDLRAGRVLWTVPVQDSEFRGPLPP